MFFESYGDAGGFHVEEERFEGGVGGDGFDEVGVGLSGVHIMGDDESARAEFGEEFLEVIEVAFLIGIEEEQVDGSLELGDFLVGIALDQSDEMFDLGAFEVGAGLGCAAGVDFVGREFALGLFEGEAEPEAGVADGGADFDDVLGVDRFCEEAEDAAVSHGDAHTAAALGGVHGGEDVEDFLFAVGMGEGLAGE
ncbi:MAG: hypothetical protein RI897_4149, partial [Verrucomicrobiota bacterium]